MIKLLATRAFLSQPIQLRKCSLLEFPGVKDLQPNLAGVATAPLAGSWGFLLTLQWLVGKWLNNPLLNSSNLWKPSLQEKNI